MSGRERLVSGRAMLYYIHGVGYGEVVEFLCTGHGGPYATSLAKFLLKKDLNVDENAKRIAFIISWVAEDVDVTVGGDPDVVIIRDSDVLTDRPVEPLDSSVANEMKNRAREFKEKIASIIFSG